MPERLRKACNECSAAKVKCSGQHNGCQRCLELGQTCLYQLSRVGKVPGARAKKSHNKRALVNSSPHLKPTTRQPAFEQNNIRRHSNAQSCSVASPLTSQSIHTPVSIAQDPTAARPAQCALDDSFFADMAIDMQQQRVYTQDEHHAHRLDSVQIASDPPSLDFDSDLVSTAGYQQTPLALDIFSGFPSPPSSRAVSQILSNKSDVSGRNSSEARGTLRSRAETESKSNSKCILACVAIISKLEIFIDARVQITQLALDTIKSCLTTLNAIIQQSPMSDRCHLLLVSIMDQIILVIEISCKPLTDQQEQHELTSGLQLVGGLTFDAGIASFGGVDIDPGEQRAMQARAIRKELNHVHQIWRQIKTLIRARAFQGKHGDDWSEGHSRPASSNTASMHSCSGDDEPHVLRMTFRLATLTARIDRIQSQT